MSSDARNAGTLPNFGRALRFLGPHRRTLVLGLTAAIGVSVFYTFSISSVVPLLKVIFAEHETLVDWIHRSETERRLGIVVTPDVPDDPRGLSVLHVRPESPSHGVLSEGHRIVSVDGKAGGAYDLMARLATMPESQAQAILESYDGDRQTVQLSLRSAEWWSGAIITLARWLPAERDAASRLWMLGLVMLALVLVALLGGMCRFANEGLVAAAVQRSMHDLRTRLADHVLHLPMHWHTSQPPGDTLGRFATDIAKVEVGLSTLFGKVFREPLKAVGVLVLTLLIDWRLLVVAVLGLPIGVLLMRQFGRMVKRSQKRASQSWGRLLDHLGEKLAGIRIVKAYNMQDAESRRFDEEGLTLTRAQTHIELVDAATNPALEVLAMMAVASFVLYGGSRVFSQELEPHLFFAAVLCLGGVLDPVRKMGNVNNRLQAADASAKRLFELLDLPSEEPESAATAPLALPTFRDTIEFRGVCFAYPTHPDRLILDNVDLTVRRGQVVALVGPNGSGKTTLISLLLRFYEPLRGKILIDGHNIATHSLASLRAQIGLVTQDSVVFSETVRQNIAYGANGVTEEQVRRAAARAHADDFVQELYAEEDGRRFTDFDTPITARSLSGGQRQRLALARAILRDPPILILDEATSQVDAESEQRIQEALEDVTRDRTTFIIAHRFSTIARADLTVVLNEGHVVATGRHSELLQASPFYVSLCQTQFAHHP